jgi:hypothetical protein
MHPWVIWNLAEERVEEFHGHRHRYSPRYQPWLDLKGASPRRQGRQGRQGRQDRQGRQGRLGMVDRLAGWAGRGMITTGTRLARRGRPGGISTEALGAAR